jgi:transposase-like protein
VGRKALVAIAAEIRGQAIGRIRMRRIRDSSADSLRPFIHEAVMPSGVVVTDGLPTYLGLPAWGYRHERKIILGSGNPAHVAMPRVHRVASLLDRWWLGTYQGAIRPQHLDYYLDEFTFRFNRRASRSRGKLFYRLMQQAAVITPTPYQALVGGRSQPNRS